MTKPRLAALALTVLSLIALGTSPRLTRGQTPDVQEQVQDLLDAMRLVMTTRRPPPTDIPIPEPDQKHREAVQKADKILDEQRVECKRFREAMSLAKFLAELQKQLPKGTLALRIDAEAFGDKGKDGATRQEVEATAVSLKHLAGVESVSLRTALEEGVKKIKIKADYRVGPGEVIITSRAQAGYASVYDISDLVAKPGDARHLAVSGSAPKEWPGEPAQRAAQLVHTIVSSTELYDPAIADRIQVLNGSRLVIRTTGSVHPRITELLDVLRRLGDVAVILNAQLYEVNDALYKKVKNARRLSPKEWDDLPEKQGREEPAPQGEPLLKKENLVLAGDGVWIDNGQEVVFLSRYQAVDLLPSPDELAKGEAGRQAVLEGVSFLARTVVSGDRRFVRVKLTERAGEIQEICGGKFPRPIKGAAGAEVPLLKEATQSQMLDIPDGGSILVPVQFRPRSVQAKERWWVLHIQPRIYIDAEERFVRETTLQEMLPALVADILKNPRLKSTRDFYGSPNDKRLALVNSSAFPWPVDFWLDVGDHQLSKAERKGKRLLGIRIDASQNVANDKHAITLTLLNVGGTENGAVPGGGTIHYIARRARDGWTVELSEGP